MRSPPRNSKSRVPAAHRFERAGKVQGRRGAAASGALFLFAAKRPLPRPCLCISGVRFSPKTARHHPESTRVTVSLTVLGRRFASRRRTGARRAQRRVSRPPRAAAPPPRHGFGCARLRRSLIKFGGAEGRGGFGPCLGADTGAGRGQGRTLTRGRGGGRDARC